jgi:hypothetical protein
MWYIVAVVMLLITALGLWNFLRARKAEKAGARGDTPQRIEDEKRERGEMLDGIEKEIQDSKTVLIKEHTEQMANLDKEQANIPTPVNAPDEVVEAWAAYLANEDKEPPQ